MLPRAAPAGKMASATCRELTKMDPVPARRHDHTRDAVLPWTGNLSNEPDNASRGYHPCYVSCGKARGKKEAAGHKMEWRVMANK